MKILHTSDWHLGRMLLGMTRHDEYDRFLTGLQTHSGMQSTCCWWRAMSSVITRPTGAGKSTILDAICLALYGRTPRLHRINQASKQYMAVLPAMFVGCRCSQTDVPKRVPMTVVATIASATPRMSPAG